MLALAVKCGYVGTWPRLGCIACAESPNKATRPFDHVKMGGLQQKGGASSAITSVQVRNTHAFGRQAASRQQHDDDGSVQQGIVCTMACLPTCRRCRAAAHRPRALHG